MAVSTHHLRLALERDFHARMLMGGVLSPNEARGLSVHRPEPLVVVDVPQGRRPWPGHHPLQAASRHGVVSRLGFGGGFPRSRAFRPPE